MQNYKMILPPGDGPKVRLSRQTSGQTTLHRRRWWHLVVPLPGIEGPVVLHQLRQRHRTIAVHIHPGIQHTGQLPQQLIVPAPPVVEVSVDHVAPLVVQHGIVAQEDVGLPIVDLVEVRHRLEPAVQPPGVLIAGVVVATDH